MWAADQDLLADRPVCGPIQLGQPEDQPVRSGGAPWGGMGGWEDLRPVLLMDCWWFAACADAPSIWSFHLILLLLIRKAAAAILLQVCKVVLRCQEAPVDGLCKLQISSVSVFAFELARFTTLPTPQRRATRASSPSGARRRCQPVRAPRERRKRESWRATAEEGWNKTHNGTPCRLTSCLICIKIRGLYNITNVIIMCISFFGCTEAAETIALELGAASRSLALDFGASPASVEVPVWMILC